MSPGERLPVSVGASVPARQCSCIPGPFVIRFPPSKRGPPRLRLGTASHEGDGEGIDRVEAEPGVENVIHGNLRRPASSGGARPAGDVRELHIPQSPGRRSRLGACRCEFGRRSSTITATAAANYPIDARHGQAGCAATPVGERRGKEPGSAMDDRRDPRGRASPSAVYRTRRRCRERQGSHVVASTLQLEQRTVFPRERAGLGAGHGHRGER